MIRSCHVSATPAGTCLPAGSGTFRRRSRNLGALALVAAILTIDAPACADPLAEGFRKLTGAQIRAAFTGKSFSDDVHFSFRYTRSGDIEGAGMGKKASGKWRVAGDQLCQTDSDGDNCFDIWRKGRIVKFVLGEDLIFVEGSLE